MAMGYGGSSKQNKIKFSTFASGTVRLWQCFPTVHVTNTFYHCSTYITPPPHLGRCQCFVHTHTKKYGISQTILFFFPKKSRPMRHIHWKNLDFWCLCGFFSGNPSENKDFHWKKPGNLGLPDFDQKVWKFNLFCGRREGTIYAE